MSHARMLRHACGFRLAKSGVDIRSTTSKCGRCKRAVKNELFYTDTVQVSRQMDFAASNCATQARARTVAGGQ